MAHDLTLVLMGRTGNGKSATGNSILGRKEFKSRTSSSDVTRTSEVHSCLWNGRQKINVIDTPELSIDAGLFDPTITKERVSREIVKCINLVSAGFHAILFVLSVRTRFSEEEQSAIQTLQQLFGTKVVDYIIVVFTGGDELEDNDETMDDYLGRECPVALKDVLALCNSRCVLVNNKTKSEAKMAEQRDKLLGMVNMVIRQNGGQPYTHELFSNMNFESKLNEVTARLEQKLEEERNERMKVEQRAQQSHRQYTDEIQRLTDRLNNAIESRKSDYEVQALREKIYSLERRREQCPIL